MPNRLEHLREVARELGAITNLLFETRAQVVRRRTLRTAHWSKDRS